MFTFKNSLTPALLAAMTISAPALAQDTAAPALKPGVEKAMETTPSAEASPPPTAQTSGDAQSSDAVKTDGAVPAGDAASPSAPAGDDATAGDASSADATGDDAAKGDAPASDATIDSAEKPGDAADVTGDNANDSGADAIEADPAATADMPAADAAKAAHSAPIEIPADKDAMPPAGTYVFDPQHSQIAFEYDHMGFSTSRGFVNGIEGKIMIDPDDLQNASVEASFPLSAVQTINEGLDKELTGEMFANVTGDSPVVTFKSTSVELDSDGDDKEADVYGDLTLNGVTKSVKLEVEYNGTGPNPMNKATTAGFNIETKIKRSDFNLGAFAPAVEDELEIEISIEAVKEG